jgi:hypothetical protein
LVVEIEIDRWRTELPDTQDEEITATAFLSYARSYASAAGHLADVLTADH